MTDEATLHAEALSFAAGGRMLVEDASLALRPGRITAMVGPNGAGKSTLLKLASGELKPAAGRIRLGNEALADIPTWRLACRRAVMAQQTRLAFPFSVYEVVRLGMDGIGRALSRRDRESIVAECLDISGVLDLAARSYPTLSGGEQQRVQFARALCQLRAGQSLREPQILFLDEPVANLDLCHQLALLEMTRTLAERGVAVLVVLHDLNLATAYADELVVMSKGGIVARGTPAETLTDALLRDVFAISLGLGRLPAPGTPFLLPQQVTQVADTLPSSSAMKRAASLR